MLRHFYIVDFLRGLAAILILVWHYHHFYFTEPQYLNPGDKAVWNFAIQPFYEIFYYVYHYGYWAVQLFWVISGFVFGHIYFNREVTVREFVVNRFSRLYPLHFVTLIIISFLQLISINFIGDYQIVGNNDYYHFILNLFFASSWGFENSYSFNSPIWSVSVEVLIYFVFLIYLLIFRSLAKNLILLLVACCLFFLFSPFINKFFPQIHGMILICGFYFFVGLVAYKLVFMLNFNFKRLAVLNLAVLLVGLIFYYFVNNYGFRDEVLLHKYGVLYHPVFAIFFVVLLYCAVLFDLAGLGERFKKYLSYVGDSTYSIYLIHMPLQVLIMIFLSYYSVDRAIFNQEIIFIFWILSVVFLARYVFVYIEKPAQSYLRSKLLKK